MNRKQTELALMEIAKCIAKEHGLTIVSTQDAVNGLWDVMEFTGMNVPLSDIFAQKYGERLIEVNFMAVPIDKYDLRKDFRVKVGYQFSDPRISVGTQWGEDGFASVTFAGDDNDENFQMENAQVFCESGIKYFTQIINEWHDKKKVMGEEPCDWDKKDKVKG